jgi:threonine aldolase
MLSGTILRQAEANLYLLRSYVAEARARKMVVENQIRSQGTVNDWDNFAALAAVARKAQDPLRSNDFVL